MTKLLTDEANQQIRYIVATICRRIHYVEKGSGHDYVLSRALVEAYRADVCLDNLKPEAAAATNFSEFLCLVENVTVDALAVRAFGDECD